MNEPEWLTRKNLRSLATRNANLQVLVGQFTPSLLARAFAGKLVPQDPTDEPGEKLLERISKARKV